VAAQSSNPAFRSSAAFGNDSHRTMQLATPSAEQLDELYGRPAATPLETERMTYEDTIVKTVISFGILLVGAVVGWMLPALAIPAAIIGFVLALINIFKKQPSRGLVLAYAAFEGVFVGGISVIFENMWGGIVTQAVLGTLAVVGVTLALFANGKIRASKRATKIFLIAMIGYAAYSLVNAVLVWTGVNDSMFGLSSGFTIAGIPLGLVLAPFIVLLGAYSLVLDFDTIQQGVRRGAPRAYGWQGAFGIMVTVVWLYVEILRILGIARSN
jgi:uncharacterized YccA/Bax inhibitor family protein